MRGTIESPRRRFSYLAFPATLLSCQPAFAERFVEYLHVEAGSGTSGGGHAAMRIGETTYHYVYAEPGLIDATAEPNEDFEYAYRALGNRSIHVHRIVTDDAAYDALAEAFTRRHITQRAQLARLAAAERDTALIAHLRAGSCGSQDAATIANRPRLRAAGYFESTGGPTFSATPPVSRASTPGSTSTPDRSAIDALRAEIDRTYGGDHLARRERALEGEIARLVFSPTSPPVIVEGRIPIHEAGFAERYETLVSEALALDVLVHEPRPVLEAYKSLDDPEHRLTGDELALLRSRAATLRASLVRLTAGRRRDWGHPMLIGMARLVALDASIRSGRLVVADSFDDAGAWVAVEALLDDPPVVDALLRERRSNLDAARAVVFASPETDELAWSRFEIAFSAMLELRDAVARRHGDLRGYPDAMLPSRSAELDPTWPVPAAPCDTLMHWEVSAKSAEASLRDRLRETYRYDVVSRNCVTEIFRTIDAASVRLGTDEHPAAGLGFIPFVAAGAVDASYPVRERTTLPSYRAHWLARLRESEGRLRTALRESNTLTATLRHSDERDDVFLFYTEDATVLRPLYGAVNAAVGASATVAGLATLPFDGGRLLFTAARSFVFSMPEIAFVSFRKGRNGILPRAWTTALADQGGAAERDIGSMVPF